MTAITKTGQDMPKKIAILSRESDEVFVRSLPSWVSEDNIEQVEDWIRNDLGFSLDGIDYMTGDFTLNIDN